MHPLSCKPISPVPKLANRTPFSFVIDSFLVRTANYAIADCDGSHLMLFEKFKNFAGNGRIGADVAMIYFPGAQLFRFCILRWHDAHGSLCGLAQVRAIEGNRRNRPSAQSLPGFLSQALEKAVFHHAGFPETMGHDRSDASAGMYGMMPLAKATSWISRGIVRRSTSRPSTSAIHTSGLLPTKLGSAHFGSNTPMDFPPWSGGVRSERHAAARMVIPSMLARASAGVR